MTAPKKPRSTSSTGDAQPPTFEMTAEELALAIRFFSACRRMNDAAHRNCLIFADVAEQMAEQHPLHKRPALRLVGGGVQ